CHRQASPCDGVFCSNRAQVDFREQGFRQCLRGSSTVMRIQLDATTGELQKPASVCRRHPSRIPVTSVAAWIPGAELQPRDPFRLLDAAQDLDNGGGWLRARRQRLQERSFVLTRTEVAFHDHSRTARQQVTRDGKQYREARRTEQA